MGRNHPRRSRSRRVSQARRGDSDWLLVLLGAGVVIASLAASIYFMVMKEKLSEKDKVIVERDIKKLETKVDAAEKKDGQLHEALAELSELVIEKTEVSERTPPVTSRKLEPKYYYRGITPSRALKKVQDTPSRALKKVQALNLLRGVRRSRFLPLH